MAERKPANKGTPKSAESTTAMNKTSSGFADEERAAMKERGRELKADARRGRARTRRTGKAPIRPAQR